MICRYSTKCAALILSSALTASFTAASHATILTFDQARQAGGTVVPTISGRDVETDYGDRVSASVMTVPGGQFTYGDGGEGFTPNVTTEFFAASATPINPGISLWQDLYGDLTTVVIGNNGSLTLNVRLTADPGFQVQLHRFDLAGWPNTDYVINAVRVVGGTNIFFSQNDVLIEGNLSGNRHTSFDFASALTAAELLIQIDYSNLLAGQQDNIGIDNIHFGQTPPAVIPLPAAALLFGSGWVFIAARRHTTASSS